MKTAEFRLNRPQTSPRSFVIRLMMQEDGTTRVPSCELVDPKYRNKISFREDLPPEQIFVATIANTLRSHLNKLSMTTEVWSLPSLSIEIPGLTLAGAHLMMTHTPGGDLSIIFRFSFYYGEIDCAFLEGIGFTRDSGAQSERLAVEVLSDLALPLMNICHSAAQLEHQPQIPFNKFGRDLAARAEELQMQINLVRRFIERREPFEKALSAERIALDEGDLITGEPPAKKALGTNC